MAENQSHPDSPKRSADWEPWLLAALGILIFCGLFLFPSLNQAALRRVLAQAGIGPYLPMIYRNAPYHTETPTPTVTVTGAETATPTVTPTPSPTLTGTQPTPTPTATETATGTLTPSPGISVKVTPTEARIGQSFTFSIEVINSGNGPSADAVVADSFPAYIDVDTVTTSKGTVQKSAHSFTVALGPIIGGEKITITAVVKVNSSATKTETLSNVVTLTYGGVTKTASVSYKVVVTGLPGTGELPLDWRERLRPARADSDQMAVTLLGLLGGLLLLSGTVIRGGTGAAGRWMIPLGGLMLAVALLAGCTIARQPQPQEPILSLPATATQTLLASDAQVSPVPHRPAYEFSTPEAVPIVTLPSYPIPTPQISATPQAGQPAPDTSPVVRIAIPALVLDTKVAYVPWDGYTWWITGLREEVAWLGNTSWPGLGSNTALAGHVTVRGLGDGPFRHLDELPAGEIIMLYTERNVYTYKVREKAIVEEGDLTVTAPTANPQVTLITCVEWNDELQMYLRRLVVFADLVDVRPIE